jgi:hypothetical protein
MRRGITTVVAPVNLFFSTELANAGITNIPTPVNTIVYDNKGNSIWFHHTSINSIPISPTRVNISGAEDIIGGSGKFSGAIGRVTRNAFFNPQNLPESSFWQNGWIRY